MVGNAAANVENKTQNNEALGRSLALPLRGLARRLSPLMPLLRPIASTLPWLNAKRLPFHRCFVVPIPLVSRS